MSSRPFDRFFSKNMKRLASRSHLLNRQAATHTSQHLNKKYFILIVLIIFILGAISTLTSCFYLYIASEKQTFEKVRRETKIRLANEKVELNQKYSKILHLTEACHKMFVFKAKITDWTEAKNNFYIIKNHSSSINIQDQLNYAINLLNNDFLSYIKETGRLIDALSEKYRRVTEDKIGLRFFEMLNSNYKKLESFRNSNPQCLLKVHIESLYMDSQKLQLLSLNTALMSQLAYVHIVFCDKRDDLPCDQFFSDWFQNISDYIQDEYTKVINMTHFDLIPYGFIYMQVDNKTPPFLTLPHLEWLDITHALPLNYYSGEALHSLTRLTFWMNIFNYSNLP